MYIEQLYTGCLSEAAYYIESNGEAAIIDPLRDIEAYLEISKARNATIKYIFETHFHADFVSGHLDLSKATGATIVYGPETEANFQFHLAKNGEEFHLGDVTIQALHTPGHTLESTCYLLKDEDNNDKAIFTGDTLFVGDVGRPDLAQKGEQLTMEDLAGMLYNSLKQKLMPLGDEVIVYPAHGAGSSCGKNLGTETFSTIKKEKETNYALQATSQEEFVKVVTKGLQEPPQYFPVNAQINKQGYQNLEAVLEKALTPLSVTEFKELRNEDDVLVLDTRNANVFTEGFIPESISIGLEGRFAEWAGTLLQTQKKLILVTDANLERESVVRLARVGFENFAGYLKGGFEFWKKAGEPVDIIINVEPDEMALDMPYDDDMVVIDVRKETEFAVGHVKDAVNIPLEKLNDPGSMANIEEKDNLYVHCGSGYRSVIASSLFKRQGIHNLYNVTGGWNKIKELQSVKTEKNVEALN